MTAPALPPADQVPATAIVYDAAAMLQEREAAAEGAYKGFMQDLEKVTSKSNKAMQDSVVTKHPNGKIHYVSEQMYNGEPLGEFREYFADGQLKRKGNMMFSFYEGDYEEYHDAIDPKTGKHPIREKGSYDPETGIHIYTHYHPNGNVKERAKLNRIKGTVLLPYTTYREDGKTVQSRYGWNGPDKEYVASFESFHPNGKKAMTYNLDPEGNKIGTVRQYYDNGQLWSEEEMPTDPKSNEPRPYRSFHKNGKPCVTGTVSGYSFWLEPYFGGPIKVEAEDGVVLLEGIVSDNYKLTFDSLGAPNEERSHFDGKLAIRYPNGQMKVEQDENCGSEPLVFGIRREYYPNGQIEREGSYNNYHGYPAQFDPRLPGLFFRSYNPDGQLTISYTAPNSWEDNAVAEYLEFHANGAPAVYMNMTDDYKNVGTSVGWDSTGVIDYEASYTNSGRLRYHSTFDAQGKPTQDSGKKKPSDEAIRITYLMRESKDAFGSPQLNSRERNARIRELYHYTVD